MTIVLSQKRINHFRHIGNYDCPYKNDTLERLEAIYKISQFLPESQIEVMIGDKIADIVIGKTVIQVQNKYIQDDEVLKTIIHVNKFGYKMMWIVTDNELKKTKPIKIDSIHDEYKMRPWVKLINKIFGCIYYFKNDNIYYIITKKDYKNTMFGTYMYWHIYSKKIIDFKPISNIINNMMITKFKIDRTIMKQIKRSK